jgi:hypothetical protein
MVSIRDTSRAAHDVQLQILRTMTGEERLSLAFEMSLFARELARAGIRHEHPDCDESRGAQDLLRFAFQPDPLPERLR